MVLLTKYLLIRSKRTLIQYILLYLPKYLSINKFQLNFDTVYVALFTKLNHIKSWKVQVRKSLKISLQNKIKLT